MVKIICIILLLLFVAGCEEVYLFNYPVGKGDR